MSALFPGPILRGRKGIPRKPRARGTAPQIPAALLTARQEHAGHSLINRTLWEGASPYPFHVLSEAAGMSNAAGKIKRSTLQGSTAKQRWEATTGFTGAQNEDVKTTIGTTQLMSVTEYFGGSRIPVPYDASNTAAENAAIAESADYLGRFVNMARTQGNGGAGAEALLYAVWPFVDGSMGDFREGLTRSDALWHYLQEKIAQTTGYTPRIIPAHRLMARLYDDTAAGLVPGVAAGGFTGAFFADFVHPTALGAYAVNMLFYAVVYRNSPVGLPAILGVTAAQAAYFQNVAWEIATSYARAGLGGTDRGAPGLQGIEALYGTGPGQVPLHLAPEDAVLDGAGKVVSLANRGGAGTAFNASLLAGDVSRPAGSRMLAFGGTRSSLQTANPFDMLGVHAFVVAQRHTDIGAFFLGAPSGPTSIRMFTTPQANGEPGLQLRITSPFASSGSMPTIVGRPVLYEFELLPTQWRAWSNGVEAPGGPAGGSFPSKLFNKIGQGAWDSDNPTFTGLLGDVVSLVVDGTGNQDTRIATIRAELMAKHGIVP